MLLLVGDRGGPVRSDPRCDPGGTSRSHVVAEMHSGRTGARKQALADVITRALVEFADAVESSVSIRIEDVDPDDWAEAVYRPEILAMRSKLIRRPGYDPFE